MQKIAIVAGGDSSEYIISVESATNIYNSIDKERYKPYIVTIRDDRWVLGTFGDSGPEVDKNDFSAVIEGKKIRFDCVVMAIHGTPGEDGKLQAYFDLLRIPYNTCGMLTSAMTFNKYVCKGFLNNFGILSARAMLVRKGHKADTKRIAAEIGLPCFVKPNNGGSSFGASKVTEVGKLKNALDLAFKEDNEVIVEEYIGGTELTGGVIKTSERELILPITEIVSKNEFFDFNAKYKHESEEITPARIPAQAADECSRISSLIYDVLDCRGIVRIDYIYSHEKFYFLEVNTVPGMAGTSIIPQQVTAAGLDITEVFTMVIEDAIQYHKTRWKL
jgi:D-alanine-D-alanine ligase